MNKLMLFFTTLSLGSTLFGAQKALTFKERLHKEAANGYHIFSLFPAKADTNFAEVTLAGTSFVHYSGEHEGSLWPSSMDRIKLHCNKIPHHPCQIDCHELPREITREQEQEWLSLGYVFLYSYFNARNFAQTVRGQPTQKFYIDIPPFLEDSQNKAEYKELSIPAMAAHFQNARNLCHRLAQQHGKVAVRGLELRAFVDSDFATPVELGGAPVSASVSAVVFHLHSSPSRSSQLCTVRPQRENSMRDAYGFSPFESSDMTHHLHSVSSSSSSNSSPSACPAHAVCPLHLWVRDSYAPSAVASAQSPAPVCAVASSSGPALLTSQQRMSGEPDSTELEGDQDDDAQGPGQDE
jgi:hypothetical protein